MVTIVDTNFSQTLSIMQGQTAQSWAGPTMAENNAALASNSVAPAGLISFGESPSPYELTYATNSPVGLGIQSGNEGTNASTDFITDGNSGANANVSGGGNGPTANQGNYGWAGLGYTAQCAQPYLEFTYPGSVTDGSPTYDYTHGVAESLTPTLTVVNAATSGVTYTVVVKSVNGTEGASLPTGFTAPTTAGVIALSTSTTAGTTVIVVEATSSTGLVADAEVTVVLS
jgi:hypothetical protein